MSDDGPFARAAGQALVESALVLPLVISSRSGVLQVVLYAHARDVLTSAVQEGARLAAEDGRGLDEGYARAGRWSRAGSGASVDRRLAGQAGRRVVALRSTRQPATDPAAAAGRRSADPRRGPRGARAFRPGGGAMTDAVFDAEAAARRHGSAPAAKQPRQARPRSSRTQGSRCCRGAGAGAAGRRGRAAARLARAAIAGGGRAGASGADLGWRRALGLAGAAHPLRRASLRRVASWP